MWRISSPFHFFCSSEFRSISHCIRLHLEPLSMTTKCFAKEKWKEWKIHPQTSLHFVVCIKQCIKCIAEEKNLKYRSYQASIDPIPIPTLASILSILGSIHAPLLLTVLQWQLQCENLIPRCFCTILDTEGHQMGIKYSMEGFIKYFKINTVGNLKRGFKDHNGRSLTLRSVIMIMDDNMRDQHCSCIAG